MRQASDRPLSANGGRDGKRFLRLPTPIAYPLISFSVATVVISLFEFMGYYWLVSVNWRLYISYDKRPFPALAFGILASSVFSMVVVLLFSRRGLLPHRQFKLFTSVLSVIAVLSWYFLVLSYGENLIYPDWVAADILVFTITLGVLTWCRNVLSRKSVLAFLALAMALSISLAVPGYALSQRTILWAEPLECNQIRCPFGLADPTSPGPPFGELVQGRVYNFYFDVIQGRGEILLTSAPGTGNTTYWDIGGIQGFSHWNGVGVNEFEWSPGTTGFYQIVFLNQNYPSASLVVTRVTVA